MANAILKWKERKKARGAHRQGRFEKSQQQIGATCTTETKTQVFTTRSKGQELKNLLLAPPLDILYIELKQN